METEIKAEVQSQTEQQKIRFSLLEKLAANFFGLFNYFSCEVTGEPKPLVEEELDGAVVDPEYFINKCYESLAKKKEERREKRAVYQKELERANYYKRPI